MTNNIPKPVGEEEIVYQGKIIEVVRQKMQVGEKEIVFELARRSPGTRLIIPTGDGKIFVTKEYRTELKTYDYRLPGGKVFDTLSEYNEFLKSGKDILEAAKAAAVKEAAEEAGLKVNNITHFATSKCGATIEWDLFYFVVGDFKKTEQNLEHGENIEILEVSLGEAKQICLDGRMQEDRSAAVLLRYLK